MKSHSCPVVDSFLSFLYFDVFMYTYVRYTWGCKYHSQTVCVRKYLRVRATDSWDSPCCIYVYIYIYIYIRVHVYFYIYGAIKVQVNRGGLHGSAASKFCGSYVASGERAHYTIPKPEQRREHRLFFFVPFYEKNTSLRDLWNFWPQVKPRI